MIIYRYGLNKELEFELLALEVQENHFGNSYKVKVKTTTKYIDREVVETESLNNRIMYSFSSDKTEEYFNKLIEDYHRVVKGYEDKAQVTQNNLSTVLDINRKYLPNQEKEE